MHEAEQQRPSRTSAKLRNNNLTSLFDKAGEKRVDSFMGCELVLTNITLHRPVDLDVA